MSGALRLYHFRNGTYTQVVILFKLYNEELHDLYSSPSIIRTVKSRRMRLAGHIAPMGRRGTCIGCWWGSQRPLGRPKHRLVGNIRIVLLDLGWGKVDWIDLAQDKNSWRALVNSALKLRVP
jgi:hypothetical protein